MENKERQNVVISKERIIKIKKIGLRVTKRLEDSDLSMISNQIYNVLDYFWRKERPKDVGITYTQIGDLLNLNHMTIWNHVKKMRDDGYFETYHAGLPKRQFYKNPYDAESEMEYEVLND